MMQKHSSVLPFCLLIQDPDAFAFAWQKMGTSKVVLSYDTTITQ